LFKSKKNFFFILKRHSLLRFSVNYRRKKFYEIAPRQYNFPIIMLLSYDNTTNNYMSEKHHEGLFERRPSFYIFLFTSIVFTVINIFLACGVIWFDHNFNHNRTIINRLTNLICYTLVGFVCFSHTETVRYFTGPFPIVTCLLMVICKNIFRMLIIMLFDLKIILKYFLIFKVQNPGLFQDDFWYFYIKLWSIGFCTIFCYVFYIFPNRMTMMFYICSGLNQEGI